MDTATRIAPTQLRNVIERNLDHHHYSPAAWPVSRLNGATTFSWKNGAVANANASRSGRINLARLAMTKALWQYSQSPRRSSP